MEHQQLKVKVKTSTGDLFEYDLSSSDKIQSLQTKIKDSQGVDEKDQQLEMNRHIYKSEFNRSFLPNWTLEEARIKDGDTIDLYIRNGGYKLYFKGPDGKVQELDSDIYDTIAYTKLLIQEKTGHPVENQRVVFAGKQLENHRKLQDYGIQKESTLYLLLKSAS